MVEEGTLGRLAISGVCPHFVAKRRSFRYRRASTAGPGFNDFGVDASAVNTVITGNVFCEVNDAGTNTYFYENVDRVGNC